MGNSAWGNGFHKGYDNGKSDGQKEGGIAGVGITLTLGLLAWGAVAGANKVKEWRHRRKENGESEIAPEVDDAITIDETGAAQ